MFLKVPNIIGENVIGFPVGYELPKEFNIHKYIDWEVQYEKGYLKNVENIIKVLSWNITGDEVVELF